MELKDSAKRKQKQSSVESHKRLKKEDLPDTPGSSTIKHFTGIKSDSAGRTKRRIPQVESSESKVSRVDECCGAEDGDSDYEGLDEPPIRRQLQNILQQYPDGPQIIRELVQNAEDAEASAFKVMLCEKDHLGPGDFHPMYRKIFEGPALCTFNDGVFSENDWKGIKKIYTSVKEKDALKIGRFGLGFKSVFHLTDTPIIVSGDRLLVINPTRTTEKVCHNVTFKKLTSEKYKATLWPVLKKVFKMDAGGFFGFNTSSVKKEYYPNTLFWFPLRQEPSSLLDKVCPPSKIKSLMESFRKEADTILLFLQNINTITIMENKDSILYEVTIEGVGASKQEFSKSRTFIKNQLKSLKTKPDHSLSVAYNAQLTTSNVKEGHQKTAMFKIVSFFQGTTEMSQPLRKLLEEGDNDPFVGVAYPLQLDESFNAHVFCFLPLPLQSKSLTNLPIHVNGFLNLDPTRDHVLQATAGQVGKRDDKIKWNELLIMEVMSQAYVKLFVDLKREGSPAEVIYRCLPEVKNVDCKLWRKLLPPVFEHVLKMEVFQTERVKKTWVSFENAVFDVFDKEEREITKEIEDQVIELLKDYDENIVVLPKNLKSLVESWTMYSFLLEVHPKVISSRYVADLLHRDPQYKLKSRESKIILLDYFLRCADPKDFRELELLPSDDKTHFLSFVSKGHLYLCSDKKTAALFPKLEKQFLSDLPNDMSTRLLKIPNNVVKEWTPEYFSHLLKESIKLQGIKSASMLNSQDRKKVSLWIKRVWTFLSENEELIQQVENLPILLEKETGKEIIQRLHVLKGNYMLTKSQNLSPLPHSVRTILETCGMILLEEVLFVQYPTVTKYIAQPTVKDVCKVLEKALRNDERCIDKINSLPEAVRKQFAQFMATCAPCDMTNSLTEFLRRVKLFPVSYSHGATQDLYAVNGVNGIAPKGLKKFPVKYCTLLIDGNYQHLSFVESLGCQEYEEERLMEETLCRIRRKEVYQAREVAMFMKYFMDRLNDSTPNEQLEIASAIPFIKNGNKELKPPKDFFDPLNAELCELFLGEENIRFPNKTGKLQSIASKLHKLKIKSTADVTTKDLLETITFIEAKGAKLDSSKLKKKANACLNFATNLQQDSKFEDFINKIRQLHWIPVMKMRPIKYPKQMKWRGEEKKGPCKPTEACFQDHSSLVGSVFFISDCDETQNLLDKLLHQPTSDLVIQQLKHLSERYKHSKNTIEYELMLKELYEYLASKPICTEDLKFEDVVPTKSSLTRSSNIYLEFLPNTHQISLEPYMYQLSEKWLESGMRIFFISIGCKDRLTYEDLILVQEKISAYHNTKNRSLESTEIERDLSMMVNILEILKEMRDELSQEELSRVLFPIQTKSKKLILKQSLECTYTDDNSLTDEFSELEEDAEREEDKELQFVHERIRNFIAECLGVPSLTRRVMESGGIVDLEFEQWGQEEPLTTRIRNLLDDYTDGLSVYKEMLQNADDAGASCMKILYDERKNEQARTGLIDKGMEECQGPALWFYNDAKFEDKDFQNIIKLGGGTKKSEKTKIGKFGLGFCSVYNVTDVPSIVSGKYLVFFDPRTIHLGKAIKDKSKPGLRIPISKVVNKFRKQFMPYNKIFQCDLSPESRGGEYDGTLFRLPLRTAKQAADDPNGISTTEYKRGEVVSIIKKFMESAGNLLLFTQNVGRIELHYLQSDDPEKCELIYSVERNIGHEQCMNILEEAKQRIDEDMVQTLQFDIAVEVNATGIKSLLGKDFENMMTGSTSNWIVSWAVSDTELDIPGCLPVASTAIPLSFSLNGSGQVPYGFYNTGHVFCFLPLPQKSQTVVHLNGCFAVEHSRKRIVSPSPDNVSEERADWNHSLMSHELSMAYVNMLENIKECAQLENYLYSTAWPVSLEGNAFNPLVCGFYETISQNDSKVFFSNGNLLQKFSLKECVFLDGDLQNDSVIGETAFQCLQQFNPFQKQVMYMDCTIQKEFENANCENALQAQICSEKSFHTQVFLVNLQNEFWNSEIRKEVRRNLLKRILRNKGLLEVREKMKDIECIPTKPDGLLRRPSDLINPYSRIISDMFCDSDNRFPDDEFMSPDVMESLMSLGMNTDHLPDALLLERIRNVNMCAQIDCDLAKNRFRAVMRYMTHCSVSPYVLKEIQWIPFLPIMVKPKNWPCKWFSTREFHFAAPNDLFRMDCKFLIGSVQKILDETIVTESGNGFLKKLFIKSVTDVKNDLVIGQLQAISELRNRVTISLEESTNTERICDAVYDYLNRTPQYDLKCFQDLPCIWLSASFTLVKPCCSSLCSSDDAPPYVYKVDPKWSRYKSFLLNVGVHQHVEPEFILEILRSIEMKEGEIVDNLDAVVRLYNLLSNSKCVKGFPQLLPDQDGIMRKPCDMCFEDGNEKITNADRLVFTHADLKVKTCKKFKVHSKSAKFIRRFSTGVPFGQKEKLVTRVRNILEDYPCDISILNELVQNADDAKATEIHFVYDRQSHSTKGLFDESMKGIQGPALVVFNDSCFSEKDIEGISNLGEGSKSTDPNQTGQFGIGFNAVYHITDVPSFLTKGEQTPNGGTLIMFDPHCRYIPDATQESPGMKVDDLDCVKEKYTGTYNTYLQEILPASTGTWFRFPLRTKEMAEKSEIRKNGEINEKIMKDILMKFQEEMSRSLLFLNNVHSIKLSEINEEGKMSTWCEVTTEFLEDSESNEMRLFQLKCDRELLSLKKGEMVVGGRPGFSCNYRIALNGEVCEQQWHEIWAISRVFGTMTAVAVPDLLRSGYRTERVNLSPRAGIAACLQSNFPFAEQDDNFVDFSTSSPLISHEDCHFMEQDSDSVDSHISSPLTSKTSRAFCFLPLPGPTGLPVHINGHFALNSSRTHIWRDDQKEHTLKGSWNELILSDVLPFAYITSMQFHKQILFTDSLGIHAENIEKYNRYFPIIDQIKDDIWKTVVEVFYNRVLSHEIALFPVLLDEETITSMRKTDFILAKAAMIQDRKNSVVAFVPLKSNEQEFPAYFNEIETTFDMNQHISEKERFSKINQILHASKIEMTAEITKLLKMLGLKLVDSTSEIFKSIQISLNGEFIPKAVDVHDVMQFLRSWKTTHVDKCRIESVDVEIGTSLLIDVTKVMSLLSYFFQTGGHIKQLEGIPLCVLENEKLTCFSRLCPKIVSEFCHLLKKSSEYFVHKELVPIFKERDQTSPCVKNLTIAQFAELLEQNISIIYRSKNPVKWNNSDVEEKWIQEVWQFLSSTDRTEMRANECTKYLSDWCLVPVQTRSGQAYLYPLCLSYAVFSTASEWDDKTILNMLSSMQFPRLVKQKSYNSKVLLNDLCASELTPHNLLRMFQYHKEMYRESISTMTAAKVLQFLLAKLHTAVKSKDRRTLQIFRDTCLFETLDGLVTDLPENKKIICFKDNEDIPLKNLDSVCQRLEIEMLKRKDLLEDFDVDFMTLEDFYVDIFLKQAGCLENFIITTHMQYIRDAKLYLCGRSQEMKNLLSGIAWIKNEETGELQRVCDFYSPYVRVCNLLCSKKDLLPSEFHDNKWRCFMEFSGIKTEVPFDLLLKFGKQIESSSNVDEYVAEKSQVLVDYILQHKKMKDMGFPDFMRKFRKIKCVVPFQVLPEYTSILPQHEHCGLVCFEGSVASRGWEIMWSRCDIVPEKTIKNVDRDILGIKSVPDVSDVINHIHTLCRELRTRQCSVEFSKVLMEQIYSKLDELLSTSCNSRLVTEELKRGLTETPFIYDKATDKFLHPYEVVLRLDTGKCIDSYLYRGPEEWGNFYEMFRQIGVEDQPGFYHYLRLFHSLRSKTSSNTMTPDELGIARNAIKGLVASLQPESLSGLQLPQIVDLYLPSKSNKLILSTELVLCDRVSFERRIPAEFPIDYVKTNSKETMELLKTLDHQFRPKLMSQLFYEESLIGPECEDNGMLYNLRRVFQSETFLNGILGYIQKKKSSSITETQKSRIKHAFQDARFKTVSTLQTILNYNGTRVDSTIEDKFIYYSKSEGKMMIYLRNDPSLTSFEKCFKVWKNKLCQVLCLCSEWLLSREEDDLIQGLLQTESDSDILDILAKHEVKLLSGTWSQLGLHIPLDQHDLIDNGFCDFMEEEIVAYERLDPVADHNSDDNIRVVDSEFIYVRVMKKEDDSSEEFPMYTVFDGSQDISVRSIKLYRIIRKTEEQSADLVPFSTQRIRSEGTDKERIFADIRRMLIAAWKLPRSDRRKVIKRLFLQWHPDKNPENPNVAKDVTQFILDIIGKLQRGEIGIENYSSGYSTGHRSSYHYGTSSNEWYTFQETVNKCSSRRQQNRRKYYYTCSGGSEYSHFGYHEYQYYDRCSGGSYYRPPNPQPAVALQWLRQSKYDCIAARQQLQACIASLNGGDAVKTWNWICYKSHQSCEKAFKALLYGEDANIASRHQTTHDLSSLTSASSSSGSVQALVNQFSNSVTNLHTTMRYPTDGHIPGDQFTRQQAEAAVEIAERVIEECENCLGF
ncbi:sacsin-like isoform X1 [Ostrea edulis]|uniref:sacsin-like isoform X1 n=2 Tax=Ostrea edulis TaxID=37623 RepID=UPI0024AEAC2E|nr:sacsin-like isoform X1 [Ostrea edulis]XP_056019905.1 sacsin-like isoform X1 [Ostrea edulis]